MSKILTKITNQIFKALYFCGKNAPFIAGAAYGAFIFFKGKKFINFLDGKFLYKKINKKTEELSASLEQKMEKYKIVGLHRKHKKFLKWSDIAFKSKDLCHIKRLIKEKVKNNELGEGTGQELLGIIKNLEHFNGQKVCKTWESYIYRDLNKSDSIIQSDPIIRETIKILNANNNSLALKIKTWFFGWPKDEFLNAYLSCKIDSFIAEEKSSNPGLNLPVPFTDKQQRSFEELKQQLEAIDEHLAQSGDLLGKSTERSLYDAFLCVKYMSDTNNENKIKNSVFPKIAKVIFAAVSVCGGIICGIIAKVIFAAVLVFGEILCLILVDTFVQRPKENCFPRVEVASFPVGQNLPRVSKSHNFGL